MFILIVSTKFTCLRNHKYIFWETIYLTASFVIFKLFLIFNGFYFSYPNFLKTLWKSGCVFNGFLTVSEILKVNYRSKANTQFRFWEDVSCDIIVCIKIIRKWIFTETNISSLLCERSITYFIKLGFKIVCTYGRSLINPLSSNI